MRHARGNGARRKGKGKGKAGKGAGRKAGSGLAAGSAASYALAMAGATNSSRNEADAAAASATWNSDEGEGFQDLRMEMDGPDVNHDEWNSSAINQRDYSLNREELQARKERVVSHNLEKVRWELKFKKRQAKVRRKEEALSMMESQLKDARTEIDTLRKQLIEKVNSVEQIRSTLSAEREAIAQHGAELERRERAVSEKERLKRDAEIVAANAVDNELTRLREQVVTLEDAVRVAQQRAEKAEALADQRESDMAYSAEGEQAAALLEREVKLNRLRDELVQREKALHLQENKAKNLAAESQQKMDACKLKEDECVERERVAEQIRASAQALKAKVSAGETDLKKKQEAFAKQAGVSQRMQTSLARDRAKLTSDQKAYQVAKKEIDKKRMDIIKEEAQIAAENARQEKSVKELSDRAAGIAAKEAELAQMEEKYSSKLAVVQQDWEQEKAATMARLEERRVELEEKAQELEKRVQTMAKQEARLEAFGADVEAQHKANKLTQMTTKMRQKKLKRERAVQSDVYKKLSAEIGLDVQALVSKAADELEQEELLKAKRAKESGTKSTQRKRSVRLVD